MPVIDWTRTQLYWPMPGGSLALRFDAGQFAAFDCFMLERKGAEADHHPEALRRGRAWFDASSESDRDRLLAAIMAGLPGAYERYDIPGLRKLLARYADVGADGLRERLLGFLREIIPLAEELGLNFAIHPDDPPRPLMGLPRIVSTEADIAAILDGVHARSNGLTLCAGSLGANPANDVPDIARRFADRIHFAHLRNVASEPDTSFYEADHLGGDTDMVALIEVLLAEEHHRRAIGRDDREIPFRPDHGHEMLDDIGKGSFPGYSAIGRLKGLAELRGVIAAVMQLRGWSPAG
jgi:mannonate dehydratase